MKTAMQQLIDALNDLEAVYTGNDQMREVVGVQQARNLAEYIYFEKEKEQIVNAWIDDRFPLDKDWVKRCAESYYNETFNTNEK